MFAALLPTIPGWSHLHPLVVHFPVALLMVAPLFVLIAFFMDAKKAQPYFTAAFVLMLMGSCGSFLAGVTGDAASEAARTTPAIKAVLEQHEEMAETTQVIFGVLTAGFAAFLFLPRLLRKELRPQVARVLLGLFLLIYVGGLGVLVNTAHDGGRLVHELGIHSGATGAGSSAAASMAAPDTDRD